MMPLLARKSIVAAVVVWTVATRAATAADATAFENKIRPLFERACVKCHAGADPSGDLRLTDRAGWEAAGVIEPGRPEASRLLEVLRSADPEDRMPPPDSGITLSADEIRSVEQWIADGAFDPREGGEASAHAGPKLRSRVFEITGEDAAYWAFQPLAVPELSRAEAGRPASETIDILVRRGLQSLPGVSMSPPATPRELVRRATFDLWGLPPKPEAVTAFEGTPSDDAWRRLVDDLLGSHHYGERWGRYWLDWVRYAETNGYERDSDKPDAWRYRDYVIRSFEHDKPYDEFLLEQIAGDEWAAAQGWSEGERADRRRDAIIATGFLRLHQWDDEPASSEQADLDDADDVLVSIGTAFLGLTVGCARCHNHKYDPISQRDYYAMLSFLRGIEPYGKPHRGGGSRGKGRIQRPLGGERDTDSALAAVELPTPATTFVLHRGDIHSPREQVEPAVPAIFTDRTNPLSSIARTGDSSGRRLALARWLASPRHPLTARVMANRVWQRHFGTGIVATPDDFGRTGMPPVNQPLLDFLASELIASGWSVHHLHRIIMASHAYRMTSHATSHGAGAAAADADPTARFFWRQTIRRLDAEAIRDSMLAISGQLGKKDSGPSVYPKLSDEVRSSANQASFQWPESPPDDQDCRSVYLGVRRALKVPFLETLDFANSSSPTVVRPTTTTAPQALLLLNEPWVYAQAVRLLDRLRREVGTGRSAMLERLWRLVYQRSPTRDEVTAAESFLLEQSPTAEAGQPSDVAWTSLCRALLNSNEAIYVD